MVAIARKEENAGKPRVLAFDAILHSLLLLQPSVLWHSMVTFNNDAKPLPKWILSEFDVLRIWPWLGGLPHLEKFTWQNLTSAERVTWSGRPGYPTHDQIKIRKHMDWQVGYLTCLRSPTSMWTGPFGLMILRKLSWTHFTVHLHVLVLKGVHACVHCMFLLIICVFINPQLHQE